MLVLCELVTTLGCGDRSARTHCTGLPFKEDVVYKHRAPYAAYCKCHCTCVMFADLDLGLDQ